MSPLPTILGAAAWRFASSEALLLILPVAIIVPMLWWCFVRRRRALMLFARVSDQAARPGTTRALVKVSLIGFGLVFLVVALARPQSDPVEETINVRGRDIVFVLDVSRSMLSRDAVPNRLARAKLWINDLVNTLDGDRIGLVAFAGAAVVKSPLTMDHGFFRMTLDELTPASVPRGGTLIGDAIRKATSDVFEPGPGRYRDIILISDGEDQGSFPEEAARQAAEQGVRLILIGIGSEVDGAPVPTDEKGESKYVEYQGERVRSKLDQTTLAAIANAAQSVPDGGGGVFLNVGTGTINLDTVYHDLAGSAEQRETQAKSSVLYRELFQVFAAVAFFCLALEPVIAGRVRVRRPAVRTAPFLNTSPRAIGAAAAIALLSLTVRAQPTRARAPDNGPTAAADTRPSAPVAPPAPDEIYNQGRELFLAGKYQEAADYFRRADQATADAELSSRARFNLGQSLLKSASAPAEPGAPPDQKRSLLESAARAFRSALEAKPGDLDAARNTELARRMLRDLDEQQQQQQQQSQGGDKQNKQDQKQGQDQQQGQKQDQKQDQNQGQNQKQDGQNGQGDSKNGQSNQEQSQSQREAEKESKQHQDNADRLKELAEQQQRAADQTKKAGEQSNPQAKEREEQQAKQQQESVSEQTKQEQARQQSESQAGEQANQQTEQARKQQQAASEALEKGDTKAAEEHQRRAAELLDQAAESEQAKAREAEKRAAQEKADREKEPGSKKAEKQEESNNSGQRAEPQKQPAKEPKPKYDQAASQLLDKERRERDARQQVLRALKGKPAPVEKDW